MSNKNSAVDGEPKYVEYSTASKKRYGGVLEDYEIE